jgi:hypothetical protein
MVDLHSQCSLILKEYKKNRTAQTLAGVFRIVTVVGRAKAGIEQTRQQLWRQAGRLWGAGKPGNTSFATSVAKSQQRRSSVKSIELNQSI